MTLYTRAGCQLCEVMKDEIEQIGRFKRPILAGAGTAELVAGGSMRAA